MTDEYKLLKIKKDQLEGEEKYVDWLDGDDEIDILSCRCCGQDVPLQVFEVRNYYDASTIENHALCELCSSTMASVRVQYRNDNADMFAHICAVGNLVSQQVRREIKEVLAKESERKIKRLRNLNENP